MTYDERIDAALGAFLGRSFPGHYSPEGAEEYRRCMRRALKAAQVDLSVDCEMVAPHVLLAAMRVTNQRIEAALSQPSPSAAG